MPKNNSNREKWLNGLKSSPKERKTSSGVFVQQMATPEDVGDAYESSLGNPGEFPFTRGPYNTMYTERPWTMRQYSGFGTPEETNQRYKYLLEQGGTGLSVAFDLPSQVGLDSDHEMARGEIGRVGVAVDSLEDMETIFKDIDLSKVSTSFTINSTAAIMLAMYIVVGEKQGVGPKILRGTIQNDLLKEFAARGTWIFPPRPSLRIIADTITYCADNMPKFNPISIAGAHFRDAGATAVQEIAFTLSDAIAYVEEVLGRGMDIDDFAPRLSFFFYTYTDIFEEAAKYRAARRMWARLVKERWGAKDPKSMAFRFGVACGGVSLSAQEPLNNVVRVAYQILGAALGGSQSIFSCAYDEAYALPTAESTRLALRSQQVCAEEAGLTNAIDPLGGSYFVESLTDKIEEEAKKIMDEIEAMGGMVSCIENGTIQNWIVDEACRTQKNIQTGEKVWVGVNKYADKNEDLKLELHRHHKESSKRKLGMLADLKNKRDQKAALDSLAKLSDAAKTDGQNLMPFIIEAVKSYCTVGEITKTLKEVFGEFREPVGL